MARKTTVAGKKGTRRRAAGSKPSSDASRAKTHTAKRGTAEKRVGASPTRASTAKTPGKKTTTVKKETAPSKKTTSAATKKRVAKKSASAAPPRDGGRGSAKKSPRKAKSAAKPTDATRTAATQVPGGMERMPKTRLSEAQLANFRQMLLDKRRELLGDVRNLAADALMQKRQDASGDLSSMPIHMADLGSDNWEQEFTLGLIANERQLVREIDEALGRIENRTYGVCQATRKPITLARLRAKPWARYCIEYARKRELGRA